MPSPGLTLDVLKNVEQWKKENPASIYAEFAQLRAQYSAAWTARGTAYAKNVPGAGMNAFYAGLADAERATLSASSELRQTPILQNLLLSIILDSPAAKLSPELVYRNAVEKWPQYYHFHEVVLSRIVPRWGGSWQAVEGFVGGVSQSQKTQEGDTLYARLYASLLLARENPKIMQIDWPRMKRSLDELIQRYPAPIHKNFAASYACLFKDQPYFEKSIKRMSPEEYVNSAWFEGTDPVVCKF